MPTSTAAASLFDTIVRGLVQARRSGVSWQPASFDPALEVADAYRIQDAVASEMGWFAADGGRVPGWKAGGKGQMTAAPLPVVLASGATWQPGATRELLLEAEVAFRLGRTPASAAEVLACIGSVCVSIEIVGTRMVGGLSSPGPWKTADQQMHGVLVSGPEMPYAASQARDWAQQGFTAHVNGTLRAGGKGSHPNGNATEPLPWLFAHAQARGRALRAGDLVTTGAWAVAPIAPGDLVEVAFSGIGAASVRIAG